MAFLRDALVAAEVLPRRDERLAALERWIPQAAEAVPDDNERQLVRRFATWHHLRRVRRDARSTPITTNQTAAARSSIRGAIALLAFLRQHGTNFEHCTQSHLDEWISGGTTIRYAARGFVEWCLKNPHIRPGLTIPNREKLSRVQPTDEDKRWALCRCLMHDDSIAIEDRFAGLLVLLYAQPLSVISRLPVTSVIVEATKTSLTLGEKPQLLPDPIDKIAQQLLARRRGH